MTYGLFLIIMVALLTVIGLTMFLRDLVCRAPMPQGNKHSTGMAPPDWTAFESYTDLADALEDYPSLSKDAFLNGPFQRYLELASDARKSPRASARVMELCRGSLHDFVRQNSEGADGGEIEEQARAMAANWFADPQHCVYMLEVLDGVSNHNYRTSQTE